MTDQKPTLGNLIEGDSTDLTEEQYEIIANAVLDQAVVAIHLSEHPDINYETCAICPDFRAAVEPLRHAR